MSERIGFLREVTEAFGPPGLEDEVATILERETREFCEVSRDGLGSFIARKQGTADAPRVLFAGHMDEVAFMVTEVDKRGFVRMRPLGGWWPHVLLGQRVKVRTRKGEYLGIVGSKPPHELKEDERQKVLRWEDIFVDMGVADGFDVKETTGVRRGDFIVPDSGWQTMVNENLAVVKAWDNRVGCALAVDLLKELRGADHPNTVYGVATVQEEVGLRGAATSAESVRPDIAIALDVGIAKDTPGFAGADTNEEKFGGGAGVLLLDKSLIAHPRLARFVQDVAEEHEIPFHATTMLGGGTDAGRFHVSGTGVPSLAICVPSRYIHSHNSVLDLRDYEATLKLCVSLCTRLDAETVRQIRG